MDPVTGGAIIAGLAGLMSNLLGVNAQSEAAKKKAKEEAIKTGFEAQVGGAKSMGEGQMAAYQQLLNGYKSSLIGG